MFAMQFTNLGFLVWQNLGFPVDTKLGVSSRLSCDGGTRSGRDLEIIYLEGDVGDDNELRWGRM
jgi:hypothetical protein